MIVLVWESASFLIWMSTENYYMWLHSSFDKKGTDKDDT